MNEEKVEEGWRINIRSLLTVITLKDSQKAHCQGKKKKMNEALDQKDKPFIKT